VPEYESIFRIPNNTFEECAFSIVILTKRRHGFLIDSQIFNGARSTAEATWPVAWITTGHAVAQAVRHHHTSTAAGVRIRSSHVGHVFSKHFGLSIIQSMDCITIITYHPGQ
jgi:hypothetical protein